MERLRCGKGKGGGALSGRPSQEGEGKDMARYGMVVDLTRCTGCQTCVVACQMQHNTRPDVRWSSVDFMESGRWPERQRFALPHACMHCDDAPCVAACPAGAQHPARRRHRGRGLRDLHRLRRLRGRLPVRRPPRYGAEDRWNFDAAEPAPYEAYGVQRLNVAEKCVFCHDRAEQGETSWCASVCPNGARVFGDLDDPASEICAYIEANGAEQIPGTAVYYVKGGIDADLPALLTASTDDAKDGE